MAIVDSFFKDGLTIILGDGRTAGVREARKRQRKRIAEATHAQLMEIARAMSNGSDFENVLEGLKKAQAKFKRD